MNKYKLPIILLLCLSASFVIAGCGSNMTQDTSGTGEVQSDDDFSNEGNMPLVSDSDSEDNNSENIHEYIGMGDSYEAGEYYNDNLRIEYHLIVRDDGTCDFCEYYMLEDGNYTLYFHTGTYETDGYLYVVTNKEGDDLNIYNITVEGDKITSAERMMTTDGCADIAGTYTCADDVMGMITLEISTDGSTCMLCEGRELFGQTYHYNDCWETVVSDDDGINHDWYIYFDGSQFTYEDYYESKYERYYGTYNCDGDLGTLSISVEKNGDVTLNTRIDDKQTVFTGRLSGCEGDDMNMYLSSDDEKYILELHIYCNNGEYTYSGTLSQVTNL